MRSEYIMAVEKKLAWRRLFDSGEVLRDWKANKTLDSEHRLWFEEMDDEVKNILHGDVYYVNPKFCSMVNHARLDLPMSMKFDPSWIPSEAGVVFFGEWFKIPKVGISGPLSAEEDKELTEIGGPVTETEAETPWIGSLLFGRASDGSIELIMFLEKRGDPIPYPVFHEYLTPGMTCREFLNHSIKEGDGDIYVDSEDPKHPVRLVFALFYLMSQKLAMNVREPVADRALIRRAEKAGQELPDDIKIITLRRLEAARKEDPKSSEVNWRWQWEVRGHWRNQYHPSTGEHETIFIEAYIKGPEDKPLKHCSSRLFLAAR